MNIEGVVASESGSHHCFMRFKDFLSKLFALKNSFQTAKINSQTVIINQKTFQYKRQIRFVSPKYFSMKCSNGKIASFIRKVFSFWIFYSSRTKQSVRFIFYTYRQIKKRTRENLITQVIRRLFNKEKNDNAITWMCPHQINWMEWLIVDCCCVIKIDKNWRKRKRSGSQLELSVVERQGVLSNALGIGFNLIS